MANYLSPYQHNITIMTVDCELLLSHFYENGFKMMSTHTFQNHIFQKYHILWNEEKSMICLLETFSSSSSERVSFNDCTFFFELETSTAVNNMFSVLPIYVLPISHHIYRELESICFHEITLHWRLDIKQDINTLPKLYREITKYGNLKTIWESKHDLSLCFGTYNYSNSCQKVKEIISEIPKEFLKFLHNSR